MDQYDLSYYSQKEKAEKFTEDGRAGLYSLKEAFDYVKAKCDSDAYTNTYKEDTQWLMNSLKAGDIVPASSSSRHAFLPAMKATDVKNKLAKFAV